MLDSRPSVLIIEDNVSLRSGLQLKLLERGFHAEGAESIADGKNILNSRGEKFDVILVDMNLADYEDAKSNIGVDGSDLVIEFYKKFGREKKFHKPEPIIFSQYHNEDYYQKALQLGAATYLSKPIESGVIIRHLRALAIKRILSGSVNLAEKIEDIVLSSPDEASLYDNLCNKILGDVFSNCLGAPFVLLLTQFANLFPLTDENHTDKQNSLLSEEESVHKELLSLMYLNTDLSKPFVINDRVIDLLKNQKSDVSAEYISKFEGAAFISLPLTGNFRLSIGILQGERMYSEPPEEMAQLLISYVNPATILFLGEITERWHKSLTERNTTIRKLATFCNNVGREQLFILEDADLTQAEDKYSHDGKVYRQIKDLAEDLHHTGRLLEPIAERKFSTKDLPQHSMKQIIDEAWKEIKTAHPSATKISFSTAGDCLIHGEQEEFFLIIFRFLHWFSRRQFDVPENVDHSIKVTCREEDNHAVICWEDNSYRIPFELRKKLFNAFSPATPPPTTDNISDSRRPGLYLALYLSQIIVEEKYRGRLRECSDELPTEIGHKIEMRIPLIK